MKFIIWFLIGLIWFGNILFAQQPGAAIDVQRYIFKVELNDKNDSIKCIATIQYNLLQTTNTILLDLISRKTDGKGMNIISVTENGRQLSYTHTKDILQIRLTAAGRANETKTVQVAYNGIPDDGLIISRNKYNQRTFFSDHWPDRARHWLPCIDHPSDKAAVEFMVTAPVHYQVISNGVMIEETNIDTDRKFTHYQENKPLPMKIAAIGVADFAVRLEGEIDNIPVQSWVYPQDRLRGFYDYAMATDILPYFIKVIGPFPYKKLANIQSKTIFGGMENAGAIFYAENTITGKRTVETLMAHEIAHQWFGDMVTETDWAHVWLSEGFVTYMAISYMESKYGQDTARKMRIADRAKAIAFAKLKPGPVVDASTTNYLELLNANSYQKGGWVLHMLRKQLGDSLFWNCIRNYYEVYAGKNAATEDFRQIVEKISGKDEKRFFQQWLFTPAHPVLDIQWKFNNGSKMLGININQQQSLAFEFPLQVDILVTGQKTITKIVNIKEKLTSITIPLPGAPTKLLIDPEADLFYEGSVREIR